MSDGPAGVVIHDDDFGVVSRGRRFKSASDDHPENGRRKEDARSAPKVRQRKTTKIRRRQIRRKAPPIIPEDVPPKKGAAGWQTRAW